MTCMQFCDVKFLECYSTCSITEILYTLEPYMWVRVEKAQFENIFVSRKFLVKFYK